MKKTMCLFCGAHHKKPRNVCKAKGEIVRAYLDHGLQFWQVLHAVETGKIDLDGEAARLIMARKAARKAAKGDQDGAP